MARSFLADWTLLSGMGWRFRAADAATQGDGPRPIQAQLRSTEQPAERYGCSPYQTPTYIAVTRVRCVRLLNRPTPCSGKGLFAGRRKSEQFHCRSALWIREPVRVSRYVQRTRPVASASKSSSQAPGRKYFSFQPGLTLSRASALPMPRW